MQGRYSLVSQIISDAVQEERLFCSKSHCPRSDEITTQVAETTPGARGTSAELRSRDVEYFFPLGFKLETLRQSSA